ncbi:MAG: hypothetical protein HY727_04005 [Candidatus Rokubacteria bacterium]|nr:hypothetical protein [Candidatus Rokubacteria bacterium]
MTPRRVLAWSIGLAITVAACGGSPPPTAPPKPGAAPAPAKPAAGPPPGKPAAAPAPPAAAQKPGAPTQTAAAPAAPQLPQTPPPSYDAAGRRDPFQTLDTPKGAAAGASVATAKLTGIIRSAGSSLALVETPDGIGYILRPGDTLADGRLVEIGPNTAVFSVTPKPGSAATQVILKLPE